MTQFSKESNLEQIIIQWGDGKKVLTTVESRASENTNIEIKMRFL